MKLDGDELASYIKQRHAQEIRAMHVKPKLAIIMHTDAGVATRTYVERTKKGYAQDVGADCEIHEVKLDQAGVIELINKLNHDTSVHGIIVQLPYPDVDIDAVLSAVAPHKDIDGLNPESNFDMPTPQAIMWLLAAYNLEVKNKKVAVIGQGRLVGKPVADMLENSGAIIIRCDDSTTDLAAVTMQSDIIISATGQAGLITPSMVKSGSVIIGAGTSDIGGPTKGDLDKDLYTDESLKIARNTGGVGPVTVAALFDNLLIAARTFAS
jgi:methylenetetrahydrofolate dehydrogenase (NADP+)/methenyltetrahydrofolate cyclohydrolase